MTEQAAYINAVSDRLLVNLFKAKVVYQVYNKDNALKWHLVSDHKSSYPVALQNAIFSSSTLVCSGMPFTLGPLNDAEMGLHYSLNHGLTGDLEIQESELFAIAYSQPSAYADISKQLVGLQSRLKKPIKKGDPTWKELFVDDSSEIEKEPPKEGR